MLNIMIIMISRNRLEFIRTLLMGVIFGVYLYVYIYKLRRKKIFFLVGTGPVGVAELNSEDQ